MTPNYESVRIQQLKSSLKPSTITSPSSIKRSDMFNSKKLKLSLNSGFKTQISQPPSMPVVPEAANPLKFTEREGVYISSKEVIDDSFMTAKLRNIYGSINNSDESGYPSSNIISYNNIMCNPHQWKNSNTAIPSRFKNETKVLNSSEIRIDL